MNVLILGKTAIFCVGIIACQIIFSSISFYETLLIRKETETTIGYKIEAKKSPSLRDSTQDNSEVNLGAILIKIIDDNNCKRPAIEFDKNFQNIFYYTVANQIFNNNFTAKKFYQLLNDQFPQACDMFLDFILSFCPSWPGSHIIITDPGAQPVSILKNINQQYSITFYGPIASSSYCLIETLIKIALNRVKGRGLETELEKGHKKEE